MTNLESILKSKVISADKGPSSENYGFSSSHVWMWELDHEEGWDLKNWCFWIVALEKTPESPLDCKEIKPVNPKGNQPWIFIDRTDAEAEALILWLPDAKNWLIGKDLDAGKDWRQEEEDRGWDGWMASLTRQAWVWPSSRNWWWTGNLACCSPWGCKELDMTERLNWTEGTLRSLLQCHNLKKSILQHSAFFMV